MTLSTVTLQDRFEQLRSNKIFETFVILVIVISALMIGAKTYPIPTGVAQVLRMLDIGITLFFLAEIIIRMIAEKNLKRFFTKGWNIFDFLIVTASMIPVDDSEVALLGRLLRVFRVLRLVSIIPELRILMNAFVTAIPRMGYVSLLMFIIFYIYAAMGSMFFHEINRELWGNITISMLTLFRIATFEDWTDVMYETMAVHPLSWSFYISFIFIVAFVFLNMMIGIVLETLQREHEQFSRETGEGEAGEVHRIEARTLEMSKRLMNMEETLKRMSEQKSK
ncbi:MAG: ion transporter [Candidatus Thiodiazotropha sp. (ex Monitilora ramsayi)]|nr:ion transporter [Candidatus Thiodiazotropha sp. (ex Monitilora ramsayi)]